MRYKYLLRIFSKTKQAPVSSSFDHLMEFARDVAEINPAALIDVVRLLLRPLQSELLIAAPKNELHYARCGVESFRFFMPNGPSKLQHCGDYPKLQCREFLVNLSKDAVLPCPWHRGRYSDAISQIGAGKKCGNWMVDTENHKIVLWLPWGIAFVNGGNHSIAAGVLGAEGQLRPTETYDMSRLLDLVHCDGKNFLDVENGQVLDKVQDHKIAALFEVGRLMTEHNVVPMKIPFENY
jgi:hypothetical protein